MVATLGAGCGSDAKTCNLAAQDIAMQVSVVDRDDGVEVDVVLELVGDGAETPLSLCAESETLTVNGEAMELVRVLGQLYYVAEFESAEPSYTIAYAREGGELTASVEMPPSFAVDTPILDSVHSRSEDLNIEWSPAWEGQQVEVAVEDEIGSSCIAGLGIHRDTPDTGSYVLGAGILMAGHPSMTKTCDVDLVVTRTTQGTYPSELHPDGSIVAFVSRRRAFSSSQ